MKNLIMKNLILGIMVLTLVLPLTVSAAVFNNDPADFSTTMVTNYTLNPLSTIAWALSTTANVGEIISVQIYYHNTTAPDALNTRITLNRPVGQTTVHTIIGNVVADNAPTVSGTAAVNLTSAQSLTYIPGSLRWYPNQTNTPTALPLAQTGAEIFTPAGLNLGTIVAGWPSQGTIVLRFQVGGVAGVAQTQPLVRTDAVTGAGSTYAVLNGFVNPLGGTGVSRWFEWGSNSVSFNSSSARIGHGAIANSFSETASGLQPNTTYYYRVAAQGGNGQIIYGATMNFTTQVAQVQSPTVITNSALNTRDTQVTLNGYVNPVGTSNTMRYFQWGNSITSLTNQTTQLNYGASAGDFTQNITGLSPSTTYYYRAVAQNTTGLSYGNVLSFTTKGTVVATPVKVVSKKAPVVKKVVRSVPNPRTVASNIRPMKISIDTANKTVSPNEKILYVVSYENVSKRIIPGSLLKIILPTGLSYKGSDNSNVLVRNNVVSLNIGKINKGQKETLTLEAIVDKKAKNGDTLTTSAILSYVEVSKKQGEISDYTTSRVGSNGGVSGAANVFFAGNGLSSVNFVDWLILIILLAILFIVVRYYIYGDYVVMVKKRAVVNNNDNAVNINEVPEPENEEERIH